MNGEEDWLAPLTERTILNRTLSIGSYPTAFYSDVDVVVNCTPLQHKLAGRLQVWFPFEDEPKLPPIDALYGAVDTITACRNSGMHVFVHCQAGLNRSGLVTALALIKGGLTPRHAVEHLRAKRSRDVLCNRTFEQFVLKGNHATWPWGSR